MKCVVNNKQKQYGNDSDRLQQKQKLLVEKQKLK